MIHPLSWLRRPPKLDWIQVEVTSRCGASCTYCPRSAYADRWIGRDLSLAVVEQLAPAFERTRMVHLQGWGEPLLHPDLLEMIRIAKRAGAEVGTTSSGRNLDESAIRALIDADLDVLALSLAGTTGDEHDRLRPDTGRTEVLRAIERVRDVRERHAGTSGRPALHAALMIFRSAQSSLEAQLEDIARAGAEEVVVSSLTFVPRPELEAEAELVDSAEELERLMERLEDLRERFAGRGLRVHPHIASRFAPPRACPENIERALVIGSDGQVSPCVLTGLPVDESPPHWVHGTRCFAEARRFGRIKEESLRSIWRRLDYRRFRSQFRRGRLDPRCACCAKRFVVEGPPRESPAAPPTVPELP
jgi:MoaA/NifB/PqqE/SkfB family radical SAM enzyme